MGLIEGKLYATIPSVVNLGPLRVSLTQISSSMALFPRASFAAYAGVDLDDVEHGGLPCFALAHNVTEKEQVDSVLAEAVEAVAKIVKEAQDVFFGLHGFFADPDDWGEGLRRSLSRTAGR
jgi:hypothetical protein